MSGLFAELKRRNVIRVAAAYAVAGWLLTEVASVILPTFAAPDWVLKVLIALMLLGFPLALIFSWVYEITPEGIKREIDVDHTQSITHHTGRRLDMMTMGLIMYITPVIYVADTIEQPVVQALINYNPLSHLVHVPRSLFYLGETTQWSEYALSVAFAVVVFAMGVYAFYLLQDKVAERL